VSQRTMRSYLALALICRGVFTLTACRQAPGKNPDDKTVNTAAETSGIITGKAHIIRAGVQTEASKGTASDVSTTFYLSDDRKSIVKYDVSIGKIETETKSNGASSTGTMTDMVATRTLHTPITRGNFEWNEDGHYILQGQFIVPAEVKGTLHLFYKYKIYNADGVDYQEFTLDLGAWEFDAK